MIPLVDFPYKTSIDEQLIFDTNILSPAAINTAIAAGDSIKYHLRNPNGRTVCLHQEMLSNNGGYEALFDHSFVVYGQKHKVWVLIFLEEPEHFETKVEELEEIFCFATKHYLCSNSV